MTMYEGLYTYARNHAVKRDIYDETSRPWRKALTRSPRAFARRALEAAGRPRQAWC